MTHKIEMQPALIANFGISRSSFFVLGLNDLITVMLNFLL